MRSHRGIRWTILGWAMLMACGCFETRKPLHYIGHADLQHYRDHATRVDFPHESQPVAADAVVTDAPRTLVDRRRDEVWNMPLMEAIHIALANNRVIRSDGQFRTPGNPLFTNPVGFPSVYDPAIQESGVLFGNRGVETALADFDAQLTSTMLWGRDERIQNVFFDPEFGAIPGIARFPGETFVQETALHQSRLAKQFAHGGQFAVNKNWLYEWNNQPGRLFPSVYTGTVEAEYRHPLWAAAGPEFTRIAGPVPPGFQGIAGVSQGVVIARINQDISVADFELTVQNLLREVETLYWELYLQYRRYDAAITARNSALRSWRDEQARLEVGVGNPADEAQSRDAYFATRAQAEQALADIYTVEIRFRRLLGLPVNDCRIIRPCDEPASGEFCPDWRLALTDALTRRPELRRQKWHIKSLELQLKAADSLTNPRFDFISAYRVNAFGDRLFAHNPEDGVTGVGLGSAWHTLRRGDQTGWNLGFEFSMPIGFRQAHTQVRNLELRIAKAREMLSTQELEVSHELAIAFQDLAAAWTLAQTNYNRLPAARELVRLTEERVRVGEATMDLLLRTQAGLAEAEIAYYSSLVRYNQALADLEYRKGTSLDYNNVHLAEDVWTPAAYREAVRRAWARSHAHPNPTLHTEPPEFALPADPLQPAINPGALKPLSDQLVPPFGIAPLEPAPFPAELPPAPAEPADDDDRPPARDVELLSDLMPADVED